MNKTAVYGSLLLALGVAAGVSLGWRGERTRVEPEARFGDSVSASGRGFRARATDDAGRWDATQMQWQFEQLTSRLAAAAQERRRLEERITALATEVAALHGGSEDHSRAAASPASAAAASPAMSAASGGAAPASAARGVTPMEHALVAAGLDATTAAEIKRSRDALALSEIYLRDQATREGWLDTPRFNQELAKINQQRTPIRDEIGDDAYDRYLAALDEPNRVAVSDVLADSPAQVAGLQAGDMVLRYGDTRIFAPDELVAATRSGTAGETVQLEIIRAGQRLEIDVPRGPLGVRIAASRAAPLGG